MHDLACGSSSRTWSRGRRLRRRWVGSDYSELLIAPLHDSKTDTELVEQLLGGIRKPYEIGAACLAPVAQRRFYHGLAELPETVTRPPLRRNRSPYLSAPFQGGLSNSSDQARSMAVSPTMVDAGDARPDDEAELAGNAAHIVCDGEQAGRSPTGNHVEIKSQRQTYFAYRP